MAERGENPTGIESDQKSGLTRRQFIGRCLYYGGLVASGPVMLITGVELVATTHFQASAQHPLPVLPEGKYREHKQLIEESDRRIVVAANERRFGDIPAIREAPERVEAEDVLEPYNEALGRYEKRKRELINERFSFDHPVTRAELAIVVGGVVSTMAGIFLGAPRQDNQEQPSIGSIADAK